MKDFEKLDYELGLKLLNSLDSTQRKSSIQGKNLGFYYKIEDSTVLFVPQTYLEFDFQKDLNFILFRNMNIASQYMDKDFWFEFPLNPWEKYLLDFLNGNHKDSRFIKERFNYNNVNFDNEIEFLNLSSKILKLKRFQKNRIDNSIFLYLAICGYFKNKYHLQWALKKEYGPYNAYFVPILVDIKHKKFIEQSIYKVIKYLNTHKTLNDALFLTMHPDFKNSLFQDLTNYKLLEKDIYTFDHEITKNQKYSSLGEAIWGH